MPPEDTLTTEKLKYEIEDLKRWRTKLYFGLVTGVASAIAAVVTFLIGQSATKGLDLVHASDTLYQQALTDLGDKDPARRLSGVTAIRKFIAPPPAEPWFASFLNYFSNGEIENRRPERRRDSVILLVARLRNESDIGVVRQSLSAIDLDLQPPTEELVGLNRAAAASFVQSAAQFSGQLLLIGSKKRFLNQEDLCGQLDLVHPVETYMQNLIFRSPSPSDNVGELVSAFRIWPYLYSPVVESRFASQQRQTLGSDVPAQLDELYGTPTETELSASRADFLQKALFLEGTSVALARALDKRQKGAPPVDLSWATFVMGELRSTNLNASVEPSPQLNLARVDMKDSYIGIQASSVSFSGSDLSYSDLREMSWPETTFAGAILTGAIVANGQAVIGSFTKAHGTVSGPDFQHAQTRARIDETKPNPTYCGN